MRLCLAVAALADIGQLGVDLIVLGGLLVRVVVVVEDNGRGFLIGDSMRLERFDGQALVNAPGQTLEVDDHNGVVVFGFDQLQRIEREREKVRLQKDSSRVHCIYPDSFDCLNVLEALLFGSVARRQ